MKRRSALRVSRAAPRAAGRRRGVGRPARRRPADARCGRACPTWRCSASAASGSAPPACTPSPTPARSRRSACSRASGGCARWCASIARSPASCARNRPDLCVLIDFPEFNLRLARVAKRAGVPVLYYIGPQVWAWRRGRVRQIARLVDRLAVVFPFEPGLYAHRLAGGRVRRPPAARPHDGDPGPRGDAAPARARSGAAHGPAAARQPGEGDRLHPAAAARRGPRARRHRSVPVPARARAHARSPGPRGAGAGRGRPRAGHRPTTSTT